MAHRLVDLRIPTTPRGSIERPGAVMVSTTGKVAGESRSGELLGFLAGSYEDTGMSRKDVEVALNVHKNTASNAVKALKDRGYIDVSGSGVSTRYRISEAGREALSELSGPMYPSTH